MFRTLARGGALLIDMLLSAGAVFGFLTEHAWHGRLMFGATAITFGVLLFAVVNQRNAQPMQFLDQAARHICWVFPIIITAGMLFETRGSPKVEDFGIAFFFASMCGLNWFALLTGRLKHA